MIGKKEMYLDLAISKTQSNIEAKEKNIKRLQGEKKFHEAELKRYLFLKQKIKEMEQFEEKVLKVKETTDEELYVKLPEGINSIVGFDLDNIKICPASIVSKNIEDAADYYMDEITKLEKIMEENNEFYTDILIPASNNGIYLKCDKFVEVAESLLSNQCPYVRHQSEQDILERISKEDIFEDVVIIKSSIRSFDSSVFEDVRFGNYLETKKVHFNKLIKDLEEKGIKVLYNELDGTEKSPIEDLLEAQKESLNDDQFLDFEYRNKKYYDIIEEQEEAKKRLESSFEGDVLDEIYNQEMEIYDQKIKKLKKEI